MKLLVALLIAESLSTPTPDLKALASEFLAQYKNAPIAVHVADGVLGAAAAGSLAFVVKRPASDDDEFGALNTQ